MAGDLRVMDSNLAGTSRLPQKSNENSQPD